MNINKKDFIITLSVTLIITLIVLFIILLDINKKKVNNNNIADTRIDYYNQYQQQRYNEGATANDAVASLESNDNKYFTVKGIIDSFNVNVSYLNSSVSDLGLIVSKEEEATALEEYKQEGLKNITNMLASNYKTKYSINNESLYELLKNYSGKYYQITDMYVVEDSRYINTYYIYGKYSNEEFNYIVILDKNNYTFEIYLNDYFSEGNYSKDDISTMKTLNIEKIEENENNTFQYKDINKDEIVEMYYEEYLKQMKSNIQYAYNLLDSEYKSIRFPTEESFKNYINNVIKLSDTRKVVTYKIKNCDKYMEYVCQDNYGNIFIFKVTGVMKYTVILDTYTVPIKSYDQEYSNADDAKKAQLCLNRFFEAINNKDYEKAYSFLNVSYKESNFKTVKEFEEYIKTNWFEYNSFVYSNVKQDEQYYLLDGNIANTISYESINSKLIQKTFIVKTGNSIKNFQISFKK